MSGKGKYFKITYEPASLGRWRELHDGHFARFVDAPPPYAKRVDPEEAEETRRLQRDEDAYNAYMKRTADPRFEEIRGQMVERAYGLDPEEADRLGTDYKTFVTAYDSVRRDGIEERHRARIEAIRERQHSTSGRERGDADLAAIEEHERHARAVAAIESANYEAPELEEEPEEE